MQGLFTSFTRKVELINKGTAARKGRKAIQNRENRTENHHYGTIIKYLILFYIFANCNKYYPRLVLCCLCVKLPFSLSRLIFTITKAGDHHLESSKTFFIAALKKESEVVGTCCINTLQSAWKLPTQFTVDVVSSCKTW